MLEDKLCLSCQYVDSNVVDQHNVFWDVGLV